MTLSLSRRLPHSEAMSTNPFSESNSLQRAVICARYSSDKQREASIEDQVEVCRRNATAQGLTVVGTYTDAALSGARRFRPEFQRLLEDAGTRQFEVVTYEAVDRLGRRLADTADLQDRLASEGPG